MFEALKVKMELMLYDIEDFGKGLKESVERTQEEFDDMINDLKVMKREFSEEIKESIVDDLYNIDPTVGEFASVYKKTIDEVNDKIENFKETAANALHLYQGKKRVKEPKLADHLCVTGFANAYTHHGIYIGNNKVIHFANFDFTPFDFSNAFIQETTLEEFSKYKDICILSKSNSPLRYSAEEAIERAKSRLYEGDYNLFNNNCENFVRWCRFGYLTR